MGRRERERERERQKLMEQIEALRAREDRRTGMTPDVRRLLKGAREDIGGLPITPPAEGPVGEMSPPKKFGKKKQLPKDSPRDHPGRYPAGDESIDLAAINLALGFDIDGNQPMSLTASHGGFPSFIFGPNPPPGSNVALAGGPFADHADKLAGRNQGAFHDNNAFDFSGQKNKGSAADVPAPDPVAYGVSSYDFAKQKEKALIRDSDSQSIASRRSSKGSSNPHKKKPPRKLDPKPSGALASLRRSKSAGSSTSQKDKEPVRGLAPALTASLASHSRSSPTSSTGSDSSVVTTILASPKPKNSVTEPERASLPSTPAKPSPNTVDSVDYNTVPATPANSQVDLSSSKPSPEAPKLSQAQAGRQAALDPLIHSTSTSLADASTSTESLNTAGPSTVPGSSAAVESSDPYSNYVWVKSGNGTYERCKRITGGFGGVAMQRSPSSSSMASQSNGNGANGVAPPMTQMSAAMPVNAGQQMDMNALYQKIVELSEILEKNREQTRGIVASAEELATRAADSGSGADIKEADREISAGRIADLSRQLNNLSKAKEVISRENRENTKLIGEYETALGQLAEMVRNLAYNKDMERHAAARNLNNQLQAEKDSHLETRLDRDSWMTEAIKYANMLREAFRLREAEEEFPTYMVAALQNEVRGYRGGLGMEAERFEEETGYQVLKNVVNGAGEP